MSKVTNLLAALLVVVGFSAKADMVTVNGTEVGVYQIDNSVSSFEEFYAFNGSTWSTELEFAESNTAVFFFASLNDQLALFGLFDAPSTDNTGVGAVDFDYSMNSGSATYLFLDDPAETISDTLVSFDWKEKNGDGFVLGFDTPYGIELNTSMSNVSGLGNGVKFLSFDNTNMATEIVLQSGNFNVAAVPEPGSVALFGTALLALAGLRRTRKA